MANSTEKDVKSWLDASRYDLETARAMLKSRRYLYVLFMCQQATEKILKACATAKKLSKSMAADHLKQTEALWRRLSKQLTEKK